MKEFINYLERKIEGCDALGGLEREKAVYQSVLKEYRKAIEVIPCCKSDSELLPSKDEVYSEIKRLTELYYNDDNARKSAFGLGFSTGINFVNKDILK